jgi:murein DD-endopeptidase MepM/ murein hydrolase activator NlpD
MKAGGTASTALAVLFALAACSSSGTEGTEASTAVSDAHATTTATAPPPTETTPATTSAATATTPTTAQAPATTAAPTTTAIKAPPPSTTSAPAPVTYRFPVEDVAAAGYAAEHHDYPAADIFEGCGAFVVAPVDGTVLEVRREDAWSPQTDNPAARGGRSVSLLGRDGVRYYFAHFESIEALLEPGSVVTTGQRLGGMGKTGRASGCHLHFAISPPCPGKEWSVRRGVVAPWSYLDAWRRGEQLSPAAEVAAWSRSHPDACQVAMADPDAASA